MSIKSYYDNFYATRQLDLDEAHNSFDKIAPLWQEPEKGLHVLDIGCGAGAVSSELVERGHEVWGLDVMEEAVRRARAKGIDAQVHDANVKLPFRNASFDYVLALDVIEHVFDPCMLLREMVRVLKPTGKIIISIPNHFDLLGRFNALIGRGIVHPVHQALGFSAWDYCHIRFFTLKELEQMLRAAGLSIEERVFRALLMPRSVPVLGMPIVSTLLAKFRIMSCLAALWPSLFARGIVCRVCRI